MKAESGDQSISFATGGFDHIIRMWQPSTGRYIQGFDHNDSQVNALDFNYDGRYLAAAGFAKIRIYDVLGGAAPLTVIGELTKNVNAIGYDARSRWIFAGGEDRSGRIFDLRAPNHSAHSSSSSCRSSSSINSMLLHPNQLEILFCNDKGEISIWDLRTGYVSSMRPDFRGGPIHCVALNPEGTSMAAVNASGHVILWSLANSVVYNPIEKYNCQVHDSYALKCEFSPDSTVLATCGADGRVNLVRTADCTVSQVLAPAPFIASASAAAPSNADSIGVGASTTSGPIGGATGAPQSWSWDVAFSADSRYLVSAHSDGVARLWSLEAASSGGGTRSMNAGGSGSLVKAVTEPRLEYKGHQRAVTCLAFRDQSLASPVPA